MLTALYIYFFEDVFPELDSVAAPPTTGATYFGRQFIPVNLAAGMVEGDDLIISEFHNGNEAVLALKNKFIAEHYPFIEFNIEGLTRYTRPVVFWRRSESPDELHALQLVANDSAVIPIAIFQDENYRGEISELAIGFFDRPEINVNNNTDIDINLRSVELKRLSAVNILKQIFSEWTAPPVWQGHSNNVVYGVHLNALVYPNLAIYCVLTITLLIISGAKMLGFLPNASKTTFLHHLLIATLIFWFLGELLRWQWRSEQAGETIARYMQPHLEDRINKSPIRCERFPKDCRADLIPYF